MTVSDVIGMVYGCRRKIAFCSAAGTLRVTAGLAFVALSKKAVDIATGNATGGSLKLCLATMAAVIIFELFCSNIYTRTAELAEARMKNTLQKHFFGRLLHLRWNGREPLHSGDMLSRLTEDCRATAESMCRTLPAFITASLQLVAAFLFLWYFSPTLAVILCLLLPLFMLAGKSFFRRVRHSTRRIRNLESRLQERMQESLQNRLLLLALGQTAPVLERLSSLQQSLYSRIRLRAEISCVSRTAMLSGFEAGYLAAFIWGVSGLVDGTETFGLMTAYLQLAGQIQRPLAELARLLPGFVRSLTAVERLCRLESLPEEPSVPDSPIDPENAFPPGIRFDNVSFTYPGADNPVLNRFSHDFTPGSSTAITGVTGAGKSTLLRIVLALLKPDMGTVTLYGTGKEGNFRVPVSVATRNEIVYVPQGNSLFSGTVRDNLRMARADASELQMIEALHTAAADFVLSLPKGLDTPCGERGAGLSEGQSQRIAIARGLLRPGRILLLDEISSALDEATERLLMHRLINASRSRTILLVTHRPDTAAACDASLSLKATTSNFGFKQHDAS